MQVVSAILYLYSCILLHDKFNHIHVWSEEKIGFKVWHFLSSSRKLKFRLRGRESTETPVFWHIFVMHHIESGTLWKLHEPYFITTISVNASLCPLFIYWLGTIRLMPTFSRQNPSLLEGLFEETNNKTTENMATIDHYHSNEMRHI